MSLTMRLALLSGARKDVLQKAPGDVGKLAAMGGVLLSTAAVAAGSAFFALYSQLRLPLAVALAVGLAWGVIVFNLDRMLVVTMTRSNGKLINLAMAIPRLALALVIGTVISVPMELQIFNREITSELHVMRAEAIQQNQKKSDEAFAKIQELEQEEEKLRGVVAGRSAPTVADDGDVKAAKSKADETEKAYRTANQAAQCEFDGTCGTGKVGDGPQYREKRRVADEAKATWDKARQELKDVEDRVAKRLQDGSATDKEAAQRRLPEVEQSLSDLRQERDRLGKAGREAADQDTGLLARLEALDRITEGRASGALAQRAIFLLFLSIELLPVIVKLLSLFGRETLYDRLARRKDEGTDTDDEVWANRDRDLAKLQAQQEFDLQQQRIVVQQDAHEQTLRAVADRKLKIAMKAIDVWGELAQLKSDAELQQWYRTHVDTRDRYDDVTRPIRLPHPNNGVKPMNP